MKTCWVHVREDELIHVAPESELCSRISRNFLQQSTADYPRYHAAAKHLQRDGELEIDDNALVSVSDDGGAYVMSWVWVSWADAGLPANVDEIWAI